MDFSNFSHDGQSGFPTGRRPSHWLPALRPNQDELDVQTTSTDLSPSQQSFPFHDDADHGHGHGHEPGANRDLDPAWGIKRADSTHLLDTVQRTTSFPVPITSQLPDAPLRQPTLHRPVLSMSNSIDARYEEREALQSAHHTVQEVPPETVDHQSTFRYEEGIPLIGPDEPDDSALSPSTAQRPLAFDDPDGDVVDAFFSTVGTKHSRPSMERKETGDVLHELGVETPISDSPPAPRSSSHTPVSDIPPHTAAKEKDLAAAFADSFDDDEDLVAAFSQNNAAEDDPWQTAMAEDDDDFLVEDADDLLPDSDEEPELAPVQVQTPQSHPSQHSATGRARTSSNVYTPHQPSIAQLTQLGSTAQTVGLPRSMQNPMNAFQPPQQRPNITNRAESFVDQSKGGYKSPYDLPMDLAPKKKVHSHRIVPPTQAVPPPPRSSSMNADKQLQSPFSPHTPTFNQVTPASPATLPGVPVGDRSSNVVVSPPANTNKRVTSGFFEELPLSARVRPSQAPRTLIAQPVSPPGPGAMSNPPFATISSQMRQPPPPPPPPQQQPDPYAQYQLSPPEKLDPYASMPQQSIQPPPPSASNSRYSPVPPSLQNGTKPSPSPRYSPVPPAPAAGSRYSPAPPTQVNASHNRYVSQPVTALPHQPRTSSPLAQHRKSVDKSAEQTQYSRPAPYHATSSSVPHAASFSAAANTFSPPRNMDPIKQTIAPPPRSQTQSPSRQMSRTGAPPRPAPFALNRPASAFGQVSPPKVQPLTDLRSPPRSIHQTRTVEEVEYIPPADETAHDPLERWKGSPIFSFGFGGAVVTSFPRRTPRYSSAATRPQIKTTAGEIHVKKLDTILQDPETITKFPGPLKGKAKKKELLTWLSASIGNLESNLLSYPGKQLEEKIILWKFMKVLVEQDGNLETPQAVQTLSTVLIPEAISTDQSVGPHDQFGDAPMGIYRPATFTAKTETVDPVAVESLRKLLLQGKRSDAVWHAVDARLWSHAFLLASTLEKSVWKQVVAEFVRQEVKTIGANADSLCAFYEVLGGNLEESIDQLVPPSARAGLQMVSKVDTTGPTRNALEGLDRWKETLCLVLNNRSMEDQRALITLARLLTDYGRVEAAHVCYLVARSLALPHMFGGADDPNSMIVLVGADHRNQPLSFHHDTDAVLLTEVYEFVVSTLAPGSAGAPMPHLAVYKLQRANALTDTGSKTEAQAYCDAIAAGLKSNTKHSLYYNPLLLGEVEDLSNRLKQVPVQSASWIAKPSIEKVSGSLFNKFSSFVTGEDSDAESKGSARDAAEAGPFSKVSGSPTLSRNTSQTDLYGSYPAELQMAPVIAATSAGSRYAPNGVSSTRSSTDLTRGRTSLDYQRSPPSTSHPNEVRNLYAPGLQPQQNLYSPLGVSPPVSGYQPSPEPHMSPVVEEVASSQYAMSYAPVLPVGQPAFGGYLPSEDIQDERSPHLEPMQNNFEPPSNDTGYGYQPPEDAGYVPYQPEPESEDEKPKAKKKSFMMDDEDDFPRGTPNALKPVPAAARHPQQDETAESARKKANDDAAEAAFRAAAEADNQKGGQKKASGSWLGGWFGGAKKPDSLDMGSAKSTTDQKVHRVHLGESKMKLYYDKDKKKWINPDNPEASEKKASAPPPRSSTGSVPPPTGGPMRSVSTPYSLPGSGLSRSGTPASVAIDTGSEGGDSRPGTGVSQPPGFASRLPPGTQQSLGLGGGATLPTPPSSSGVPAPAISGPPSRPASALSNASGLDDLLGGPPTAGGRKVSGRAAKGKKGRYVDVMAQ